jgi:hypothetical protein
MSYTIREKCIFCDNDLNNDLFTNNYENYVGHYQVDLNEYNFKKIPFNICVCENCKTPQNKYLGDLNEIYKINHADNTGSVMQDLHKLNLEFILKYKDNINNILEIGSSKGTLADIVLEKLVTDYYIIEPSFFGNTTNKKIISDFYENVDDTKIDANTLIISHVFEHFYEPKKILEKITKNKNIENFFLVFPDLEYYINNDILHLLNIEHTYYVDNDFLVELLSVYGFDLVDKKNHKNHSVLFYFKRNRLINNLNQININFKNKNYNIDLFFKNVQSKVDRFNKIIDNNPNKDIYIWPSSIHTIYLCIFGLKYKKLKGFLDNSPIKIGKKVYGLNQPILSFKEILLNKENIVLINGGVFNQEIKDNLNNNCHF